MSFIKYSEDDSVIGNESVVRGAWNEDRGTLSTFYTSSIANSYSLVVYDAIDLSSPQFSIQYGHKFGSGSLPINSLITTNTPTRVNYGQYRSLIYNDENSVFNFGGVESNDFWALSVARPRFKEQIKPSSLSLILSGSSGSISLTDDSLVNTNTNFIGTNRYHTLVSGSEGLKSSHHIDGSNGSYGFLFPDMGLILLNPKAFSTSLSTGGIGLSTTLGTTNNPNNNILYNAINGISARTFKLQSQETISSRYFFTRIKNKDFNYTTNPSIIDENGNIIFSTLINDPQVYITTIGLYNDNNDLLAVAKFNKPLRKDFVSEALVRIKLNY